MTDQHFGIDSFVTVSRVGARPIDRALIVGRPRRTSGTVFIGRAILRSGPSERIGTYAFQALDAAGYRRRSVPKPHLPSAIVGRPPLPGGRIVLASRRRPYIGRTTPRPHLAGPIVAPAVAATFVAPAATIVGQAAERAKRPGTHGAVSATRWVATAAPARGTFLYQAVGRALRGRTVPKPRLAAPVVTQPTAFFPPQPAVFTQAVERPFRFRLAPRPHLAPPSLGRSPALPALVFTQATERSYTRRTVSRPHLAPALIFPPRGALSVSQAIQRPLTRRAVPRPHLATGVVTPSSTFIALPAVVVTTQAIQRRVALRSVPRPHLARPVVSAFLAPSAINVSQAVERALSRRTVPRPHLATPPASGPVLSGLFLSQARQRALTRRGPFPADHLAPPVVAAAVGFRSAGFFSLQAVQRAQERRYRDAVPAPHLAPRVATPAGPGSTLKLQAIGRALRGRGPLLRPRLAAPLVTTPVVTTPVPAGTFAYQAIERPLTRRTVPETHLAPRVPGYVQAGQLGAVSTGVGGASVTPSYGVDSNRTPGNLLLCWVSGFIHSNLPATPAGWSVAGQQADAANFSSATIFYRIATGNDPAPTIAGVVGLIWSVQLGEFSGNDQNTPFDRSATSTSLGGQPSTATLTAVDQTAGELFAYASTVTYSVAGAKTVTNILNDATAVDSNNNAVSTTNHYGFGYGFTLSNAVPDSDTTTATGANHTGTTTVIASFRLVPGTPFRPPASPIISQALDRAWTARFREAPAPHLAPPIVATPTVTTPSAVGTFISQALRRSLTSRGPFPKPHLAPPVPFRAGPGAILRLQAVTGRALLGRGGRVRLPSRGAPAPVPRGTFVPQALRRPYLGRTVPAPHLAAEIVTAPTRPPNAPGTFVSQAVERASSLASRRGHVRFASPVATKAGPGITARYQALQRALTRRSVPLRPRLAPNLVGPKTIFPPNAPGLFTLQATERMYLGRKVPPSPSVRYHPVIFTPSQPVVPFPPITATGVTGGGGATATTNPGATGGTTDPRRDGGVTAPFTPDGQTNPKPLP